MNHPSLAPSRGPLPSRLSLTLRRHGKLEPLCRTAKFLKAVWGRSRLYELHYPLRAPWCDCAAVLRQIIAERARLDSPLT